MERHICWHWCIGLAVALSAAAHAAPPSVDSAEEEESAKNYVYTGSYGPRAEWEVTFPETISEEEYARQLDFFKIEIAAVSKDDRIEYISHVSESKPAKHIGRHENDERLYIGWKSGALRAVDRRLLGRAGINSNRKELLHFFPPETQRLMQQVERAHAKRDPREIRRTRFQIRPTESKDGYEFVVIEQEPPPSEDAESSSSETESSSSASGGKAD